MLSLSEAGLISTTLQGLLHGFAIFMFVLTVLIVNRGGRRKNLNFGMLVASSMLMLLSTTEFVINIVRLVRGFITVGPALPDDINAFFAMISEPTFIIKGVLHPIQILILDGVVIYRAYIAWQAPWALVIPGIGWCGGLTSTIGLVYALVTAYQHPESVFAARTGSWIIAVYATTLATNVTATVLLAVRLWTVNHRKTEDEEESPLHVVFRVVIEAGVIYTVVNIITLVTFLAGSPSVYVIRDLLPPIISIVFNMIVVRVGFLTSRRLTVLGIHESTVMHPNSALKFADSTGTNSTGRRSYRNGSSGILAMKSLADEITDIFDTTGDGTQMDDSKRSRGIHFNETSLVTDGTKTPNV